MKIAVAMSGGVDSTTAAYILQKQGHDLTGVTARMFTHPQRDPVEQAMASCNQLGIPFRQLDLTDIFERQIMEPFCRDYLDGRTPSPCIRCNRLIKFGEILNSVRALGFDALASGHYARVRSENGRYFISRGADRSKDQSYFLFALTQEMLSGILFPLADYTKEEIRKISADAGLVAAQSKESQEICFIPDDDYKRFIEARTDIPKTGDITDLSGKILGRHHGIHRYTIGQRRGLGISHTEPLYVTGIVPEENRIIAGTKEHLFREGLVARGVTFQKATALDGDTVYAKIRSTHPPVKAQATVSDEGLLTVRFEELTQQISPGQAAVLYDEGGNILAGGWIERSL
ncbi:MAG: tRNA 2-thiouridine(34) synthase MnmA [Spirochaetota bacterium]